MGLSAAEGANLLALARDSVRHGLDHGRPLAARPGVDGWLAQPGACFVSLHLGHDLRGCIGRTEASARLVDQLLDNAWAAAFRDPRFPPLEEREFEATSIEVSLLSADEPVDAADEERVLASLRPGVDGVIVQHDARRATFLPQVWDSIADPRAFLAALKKKAGLPEDFWSPGLNVSRYTVTKWAEPEFQLSEERR